MRNDAYTSNAMRNDTSMSNAICSEEGPGGNRSMAEATMGDFGGETQAATKALQ